MDEYPIPVPWLGLVYPGHVGRRSGRGRCVGRRALQRCEALPYRAAHAYRGPTCWPERGSGVRAGSARVGARSVRPTDVSFTSPLQRRDLWTIPTRLGSSGSVIRAGITVRDDPRALGTGVASPRSCLEHGRLNPQHPGIGSLAGSANERHVRGSSWDCAPSVACAMAPAPLISLHPVRSCGQSQPEALPRLSCAATSSSARRARLCGRHFLTPRRVADSPAAPRVPPPGSDCGRPDWRSRCW